MLVLLVVAGCTNQVYGTAAPVTSVLGQTSSETSPFPAAADGSDLTACRDGDCEVVVSPPVEVPLDAGFGVDRLTITAVSGSTVEARAETSGGARTRVSGGGGGRVVSRNGRVEISGLRPGASATVNGISFRVVAVSGGTVVLAFSPA